MKTQIVLTFDTDWIPEVILEELIDDLKAKKIKATIFASCKYKCLINPTSNIEVGIHPSFDGGDFKSQSEKIKKIYPQAKGLRNHSLVFSERLRPIWDNMKVKYTSNYVHYLQEDIKPIPIAKKITEFPLFFMDRFYLEMTEPKTDFSLKSLNLKKPGLKIFDFHPIHLALNTPNQKYYQENKKNYQNVKKIKENVYKGEGIQALYNNLIEYITKNKLKTLTLKELLKNEKIS